MSQVRKIKNTFRRMLDGRKDIEMVARLGDLQGLIKADNNSNVYVTLLDGDVITVRNDKVPHYIQWVVIGRNADKPNLLQVLKSVNAFQTPLVPEVPDHDHTLGKSTNPTWVKMQQIMNGLPIAGDGLVVQFGGREYSIDGIFHVVESQPIDVSSQVPASGALWTSVEIDADGVITFLDGSALASREMLAPEDIIITSSKHFLFAVKMYEGQTRIEASDIFDPRFSGHGSGGSMPILDPDSLVITDESGEIITHGNALYDRITNELSLGGLGELTGILPNNIHLTSEGSSPGFFQYAYGATAAPYLAAIVAEGTKASPTAISNNRVIFRIRGRAYYDAGIGSVSDTRVEIRFVADDDWTPSSTPTRIEYWVTPIGSNVQELMFTIESDGGFTPKIHLTDPSAPQDGEMWLLREAIPPIPDGTPIGLLLALTYTGDAGATVPLQLSVNDNGTTRRLQFV